MQRQEFNKITRSKLKQSGKFQPERECRVSVGPKCTVVTDQQVRPKGAVYAAQHSLNKEQNKKGTHDVTIMDPQEYDRK